MEKKSIWDLDRIDLESYRTKEKLPLVVVLDNIRSLNNIGSIFRTCDAFMVDHICLCGITATPPSPEIHKTALGAEDSVAWRYFSSTMEALDALRAEGYMIVVLEQVKGSIDLRELEYPADAKVAIVAGNEVDGVDQEVVNTADLCVEIPQEGTKHSLNVSVSTGLLIWESFRRLHKAATSSIPQ